MNLQSSSLSRRINRRKNNDGFTLIELMVVVTIIVLLAGMTVAITTAVQNKAKRAKTSALIKAIDNSLERYRNDNGDYPRPAQEDELGEVNGMSVAVGPAKALYQALSGDGDDAIEGGSEASDGETEDDEKFYWEDIVNPLSSGGEGEEDQKIRKGIPVEFSSGGYLLVDPWAHPWQYELFDSEQSDEYQQNTKNMTYDLFSYGEDNSGGTDPEAEGKWITNW
ncbi:MAG: prepilin-type N-terminal cleavage/methylation domain-containing protein [Verrucomicrobiales bacterium]|jgi:prepilin-type N-terminal cleavage/methylation domain-containing protein